MQHCLGHPTALAKRPGQPAPAFTLLRLHTPLKKPPNQPVHAACCSSSEASCSSCSLSVGQRAARRGTGRSLSESKVILQSRAPTSKQQRLKSPSSGSVGRSCFEVNADLSTDTASSSLWEDEPVSGRGRLPTQGDAVVAGVGDDLGLGVALAERGLGRPGSDIDYLAELIAIQQNGPKDIGFFGTRNMGFMHQQLIEILSYAMVLTGNHIYTSGATGTNAAVIRGALRAERPELLTVVLPQSLSKQPPESQELLAQVKNVVQTPDKDSLPLVEASRLCNQDITSRVQQVICFAFHDSHLLLETCRDAKANRKIVTLFYLD